jgi:regulator of protease activity HflC (stomatin/prohibitin superfamily)
VTVAVQDKPADGAWAQSLALSFRFLYLVVAVLGAAWALSNCRVISSDDRAVVVRFGQVVREQGAGLLLAFPRPVEQVVMLPSASRQIEFRIAPFNNTASQDNQNPAATAVSEDPRRNTGMLLTGDFSVVHLKASLFYQVDDARAYVLAGPHVAPALERLFIASAVAVAGSRDLDAILVARPELDQSNANRLGRERLRADLAAEVNRRLRALADQGDSLGVVVARVDLLPSIPADAKDAFDSVLRSVQGAETAIADSRTEAERTGQDAEQSKDRILTDAQAKAEEQVTGARTRTAEIAALAADAKGVSGPALANRIYRDRIGKVLGKAQYVVVVTPDGGRTLLPGGR